MFSRCKGGYGEVMSMDETVKNWVILFARTGLEEKLAQILREKLSTDEYLPFVPAKEMSYRRQGVTRRVRKPLFPGYVFVQTGIETLLIADKLAMDLLNVKGIYSILHYGNDKNDVVVREEERLYWERLFDADFCITGSVGFILGDTVHVTSGPLVGLEGRIKKINRHRCMAVVEMEMMGATRDVLLMLEITEKVK